jgi:hypothetical protein
VSVVVSVELVVVPVLLVVESVELVVVPVVLVVESVELVVVLVVVVVVRFGRAVVVGASVVEVRAARLVHGVATGLNWLVGGSVTAAWELRWRGAAVVVGARTSASARCRGVVVKPTTLPPTAPMSTATITEVHRRDSTNRIGLKTGSPRVELP